MWEALADGLLGATAASMPGFGRLRGRMRLPRVRHPAWWKWSAAVAVLVSPLPIVVGAAMFMIMAFNASNDLFLMFIGLIFITLAFFLVMIALSFLAFSVQIAVGIATDRGEARWQVLAMGIFTLAAGVMVAFIPVPLWAPASLIVAGGACCVLGVYAPVEGSPTAGFSSRSATPGSPPPTT